MTRRQVTRWSWSGGLPRAWSASLVGVLAGIGLAAGGDGCCSRGPARSPRRADPAARRAVLGAVARVPRSPSRPPWSPRSGRAGSRPSRRCASASTRAAVLRARLRWLLARVRRRRPRRGSSCGPARPPAARACCGPLAVFGILLGVTLAAPFVARAARPARRPPGGALPARGGAADRGALTRDRSRTALTVGALAVGARDARGPRRRGRAPPAQAATAWLAEVVPGELLAHLDPPGRRRRTRGRRHRGLPGVARVSPMARFAVAVPRHAGRRRGDRRRRPPGRRPADLRWPATGGGLRRPRRGGRRDRARAAWRERRGIGRRSRPALLSRHRTAELRVVGDRRAHDPGPGGEAILVGWPDATGAARRPRRRRVRGPVRPGAGGGRATGRRGRPPRRTPSSRRRWTRWRARWAPRWTGVRCCSTPSRPSP